MWKRWIGMLSIFMLGVMAGCSGQSDSPESMKDMDMVMPAEDMTLSYAYWFEDRDLKQRVQEFEALYPNIKIALRQYDAESGQYGDYLRTALQSGLGEDILQISFKEYYHFGNSVYLCDLYEFMNNDPSFNEEDYFSNIFKAQEFEGRMPFLPRSFPVCYVGVNSAYPDAVARFEQLEVVSDGDMLEIYNSLPEADRKNLYLSPEYSITQVVYGLEFLDFRNGACAYSNQRFYDQAAQALAGLPPGRDGMGASAIFYDYAMYEETAYLFAPIRSNDIKSFLPNKEPYRSFPEQYRPPAQHVDFKPRGDSQGNILIGSTRNYSINANSAGASQIAAWTFIKYMMENPEMVYGNAADRIYTCRNLSEITMLDSYVALFQSQTGRTPEEMEVAELEAIAAALLETAGMPAYYWEAPYFKDVNDICIQMINGELTVEQGAEKLESLLGIYLME